jgi:hypothetical protein
MADQILSDRHAGGDGKSGRRAFGSEKRESHQSLSGVVAQEVADPVKSAMEER